MADTQKTIEMSAMEIKTNLVYVYWFSVNRFIPIRQEIFLNDIIRWKIFKRVIPTKKYYLFIYIKGKRKIKQLVLPIRFAISKKMIPEMKRIQDLLGEMNAIRKHKELIF